MKMSYQSKGKVEGPLKFTYIIEAIICHLFTLQIFVELLLCAKLCKGIEFLSLSSSQFGNGNIAEGNKPSTQG